MIYIITPCTRTFNLEKMRESIPPECKWVVVYDSSIKNKVEVKNAINLYSPFTGGWGNPNRNLAIEHLKDQLNDDDWLYILDDDNIIHPNWYSEVKQHLESCSMIHWNQDFANNTLRAYALDDIVKNTIDTAQYMVRWGAVKNIRYHEIYEADGIYAEDCFKAAGSSFKINKSLCYYNYLRRNKQGNSLWAKICMISMFKNEAHTIRQMLDSVTPYIDFWVLQDNGSTDGTPDIVRQWAEETGIPGHLYQVEEGWVNFGWNRDHVLQTTLKLDHSCDWIMKMDCDETLQVEPEYDWKEFWELKNDKDAHSFHVTALAPGLIYFRAWIWRSNLPWRFNHDPAHETISLEDGVHGENFNRINLPKSFRMIPGPKQGESYTVPTKYITDALKLEEKLIREGTMLNDLYHFWYIGKSYEDCYRGNFFPLKEIHQEEYARRCIFYFASLVNHTHGSLNANRIDEMGYYALFAIGNAYRFLKKYDKAIEHYLLAEKFAPVRNDHLLFLTEIYWEMRDYKTMLEYARKLNDPSRLNPFPHYHFLINPYMYLDSSPDGGVYLKQLLQIAEENVNAPVVDNQSTFSVKLKPKKRLWVVDNFYENPHAIRDFALKQEYEPSSDWYKGSRTYKQFLTPEVKGAFEDIMGIKIREWESHGMNGKFQYCVPENPLVYHYDMQTWAAMVYLTPDAPFSTGTSFYAHKESKIRHIDEHPKAEECFNGGFYDSTKFELVDTVGNVFNRLVIFDARNFHAAAGYFGKDITDSRLFQIFFFD